MLSLSNYTHLAPIFYLFICFIMSMCAFLVVRGILLSHCPFCCNVSGLLSSHSDKRLRRSWSGQSSRNMFCASFECCKPSHRPWPPLCPCEWPWSISHYSLLLLHCQIPLLLCWLADLDCSTLTLEFPNWNYFVAWWDLAVYSMASSQ